MAETKTAETKRMKLEIIEVKERQPIGDRGAVKLGFKAKVEDKELWFFTFSTRLFEAIESGKGQIIEVDIVVSEREYDGNTYTDRKVTQIYKDGQPIAVSPGGRQYGKSPEELQLSRRSFALSYAKDLAVAKLIEVKDILTKAETYYRWMGEGTISTALKTTTSGKKEDTKGKVDKPPDTKQAERDSKELFPDGGSKGLGAEEHIPGAIDMDILKDQLKELHWTEGTFKTWLVSMWRKQQWGEIDISGTLTEVIGKLNVEQREFICKEIQGLIDLK